MNTHQHHQPPPKPATDRRAELINRATELRQAKEDRLIALVNELGDQTPTRLRETVADIRHHRQMAARRQERAREDADRQPNHHQADTDTAGQEPSRD